MFKKVFLILVSSLLLLMNALFSQNKEIIGIQNFEYQNSKALNHQFENFEVFKIDVANFQKQIKEQGQNIRFDFKLGNSINYPTVITPNNLRRSDYKLLAGGLNGSVEEFAKKDEINTFKGYHQDGKNVRLTVTDNFIYGYFQLKKEMVFIEPLWYFEAEAPKDLFVVYKDSDVIIHEEQTCAATEMNKLGPSWQVTQEEQASGAMGCYEVTVNLAADWSMNSKYGGVAGAENHMFGVLNNVAGNYDDEFQHDLILIGGTTFVSTCSSCDPWTSSNGAGTLLNSFTNWGQGNGFGNQDFDVATLWTNRNLSGSTIGIAWVGAVCTNSKYNVCQDFSSNANLLRVLQAHELGHNFDANHDAGGSGTIMAPSVNGSTTWSTTSINTINAFVNFKINQGFCFFDCGGGGGGTPPTADFTSDHSNSICEGTVVNYTDLSLDSPDTWDWDFPGGTPTSSTQQNPSVQYNIAGDYDVTLTVSNTDGTDAITEFSYVVVEESPFADFTFSNNLNTFDFFDLSTGSPTTYFWDFGDGGSSFVDNPTHTYAFDGVYTVTLTVTNGCSTDNFSQNITVVTPPMADFTSDVVSGCDPLVVNFTDQSSFNTTDWEWDFPGGSPSTSFSQNPTVTYSSPGVYDVTLTIYNSQFQNVITKTAYITVIDDSPTADFSSSVSGNTVSLTNNSQNSDTYDWDFGDGNISTQTNPTHSYSDDGTYTITLTASNTCSSVTKTETVVIVTPPTADFDADSNNGCAPFNVTFNNNSSSNSNNFEWTFPGGTPATSTDEFPSVNYAVPGLYNVKLKVSNSLFADSLILIDYINIEAFPVPGFTTSVNNTTATFTNTSQNFFTQTWNFGDGNTSNAINPTHTYANFGTYDVDLIIENSCGIDTITQSVVVTSAPTANFTGNPANGCASLAVQFDGQNSTNATSYQWSFPGGNPTTSTLPNPMVNYGAQGNYDVTLIVTNTLGTDTLESLNYVTVNDVSTAAYSTSVVNRTVTFTNTSTNFTGVTWDFGDGNTSNQNNPTHTYASDGSYTVTMTTTNPCGNNSVSNTVAVSTTPSAGFAGDMTSGCAPFGVTFTNQASANTVTYQWSFPGGNPTTSNQANPVVNYAAKGVYDVTLIVGNSVGTDTLTLSNYITVSDKPTTNYTYTLSNFTQVTFMNSSTDAMSQVWYFGNGDSTTVANPTYDFQTDGVYNVELRSFNGCGFTSQTQQITVVTLPTADFNTSQGTSGCSPYQVQYNSLASANSASLSWTFPGGMPATSNQSNPVVTYNAPGNYDVTLQVTNTAGNDAETKTNFITVSTTPTAGFSTTVANEVVTITNTSNGGNSVSWNFGDGNSSTQNNPTHSYAADGVYTITQSVTNGCGTVTSTEQITIATPPSAAFAGSVTSGCSPLSVQFTNQSSANANSYAWTFMGGTPQTSTMANPTVSYNSKGNYDVQLVVTNAAGNDTLLLTNYIDVSDVPVANFSSIVNLANVQFTNSSADATAFSWDFGDGNNSSMENPTHSYNADGQYTVTLSATNGCGTVTTTQSVSIITPPTASFNAAVTSGCEPFSTTFNNQSSANAVSFEWQFPGGMPATSTDRNPTINYGAAGAYDVTLIATNALTSDTVILTNYINVAPLPTSDFTSNINLALAQFMNASANANSFSWDFGDGNTSTMSNPTHTYGADGIYTVTLTTTNSCGTTTSQQDIAIAFNEPIALFSPSATSGCAPMSVMFTNQSSSNSTSFMWSFPGGTPSTSTDMNPTVTYDVAGSYTVELIAINSIGNDTSVQVDVIEVEGLPAVDFDYNLDITTATFSDNTPNGISVNWDFGDGTTSDVSNPTHTFPGNGNYNVILTVTNDCGTSSFSQTVVINGAVPAIDFSSDETVICMGGEVTFTDLSGNDPTDWNWSFAGGTPATSSDESPTVTYAAPGEYEVTLEASNPFGAGTLTRNAFITVQEMPTVDFGFTVSDLMVDFSSNSSGADSYSWSFGDGNMSTDENPTHTYTDIGDYDVILTVTNSCGTTDTVQTVSVISSSLNETINFDQFNIYPNPNDGDFTVELEGLPTDRLEFRILNNIGQLIYSKTNEFKTGSLKEVIQLDVAQGIYLLQIRSDEGFVSRKIEIH